MMNLIRDKGFGTRDKDRGMIPSASDSTSGFAFSRDDGFSLVELLVSMVILLFVALAMIQTALVTTDSNARNVIRDEGVRLASQKLNIIKTIELDDLGPYASKTETESVRLRNITMNYNVTYDIKEIAANRALRLEVVVDWIWREQPYDVTLSTIRYIVD